MALSNRRIGARVPLEILITEYVNDRPHRALTSNVSETGVYLNKVLAPLERRSKVIGLELKLPGTSETIWARGEICHDSLDEYFHGQGVRFTGMPKVWARLVRDWCVEKRRSMLGGLFDRVRAYAP
jgi:hypothetical protein